MTKRQEPNQSAKAHAATGQMGDVGRMLSAARRAKQLDVRQLAEALHLRPSVVVAIEEGRYAEISGEIFLKGYVRAYARYMGMDEDAIVAQLDEELTHTRDVQQQDLEEERQDQRRSRRWVWIWLLLVGVAGLAYGLYTYRDLLLPVPSTEVSPIAVPGTVDPSEKTQLLDEPGLNPGEGALDAPETLDVPETGAPETGAQETGTSETIPADTPAAGAPDVSLGAVAVPDQSLIQTPDHPASFVAPSEEVPVNPVDQPSAVSAPEAPSSVTPDEATAAPQATRVANLARLQGRFDADCWIEVYDATGRKVIADLKRQGDTLDLEALPPLRLILGAANAVQLTFNDQLVDLSRFPAPNNRAAFILQ